MVAQVETVLRVTKLKVAKVAEAAAVKIRVQVAQVELVDNQVVGEVEEVAAQPQVALVEMAEMEPAMSGRGR